MYQITAEGEYAKLVTFLETLMTMVWYPSTVATLSRKSKELIAVAFDKSVDDSARFLLDVRAHVALVRAHCSPSRDCTTLVSAGARRSSSRLSVVSGTYSTSLARTR